jgi:hypothetical protein
LPNSPISAATSRPPTAPAMSSSGGTLWPLREDGDHELALACHSGKSRNP